MEFALWYDIWGDELNREMYADKITDDLAYIEKRFQEDLDNESYPEFIESQFSPIKD